MTDQSIPQQQTSALARFVHPFVVLKEVVKKKFVLRKKVKLGEKDSRISSRPKKKKVPSRYVGDNAVPLSERDVRLMIASASQNLFYEMEDYVLNRFWLNDATGVREKKKPKSATIVQLMIPKAPPETYEGRENYIKQRPTIENEVFVRQLLILSENMSIQKLRAEASMLGAKQLEDAEINTIDDLLDTVGLEHRKARFKEEEIDLATSFFLKDSDLCELGLVLGERIRLAQVLECMRKIPVTRVGGADGGAGKVRNTKFIKEDIVEHLKESENLIRRGKIVGVHCDDISSGVYYTVLLENEGGYEVQSAERKLEFPGVWEKVLREKGIIPIFREPGNEDEQAGGGGADGGGGISVQEAATIEKAKQSLDMREETTTAATDEGANIDEVATEDMEIYEIEAETTMMEEEEEGHSGRAMPPPPPPPIMQDDEMEIITPIEQVEMEDDVNAVGQMPIFSGMSRITQTNDIPTIDKHIDDDSMSVAEISIGMDSGMGPPPPIPDATTQRERNPSVFSILPTTEMIELEHDLEGESSGMSVPPPPVPPSRQLDSLPPPTVIDQQQRERNHSIFSLLPTTEMMELEEDGDESSGMLVPPPPIPHPRSDDDDDDDEIPVRRESSSNGSLKSRSRRTSIASNRRVSIDERSFMQSGQRGSHDYQMKQKDDLVLEMEMLPEMETIMHEEMIEVDEDSFKV